MSAKRHWRSLWSAFGQHILAERRLLASAYACRLLSVAAAVLAPWPLKFIIDGLTRGWHDVQAGSPVGPVPPDVLVLLLVGTFLLLAVVGAVAGAGEKNLSARVRERFTFALRGRLIAHVLTLSPTVRTRHRSGELVLRIVDDTDLFVRVLTKTVPLVFQQASMLALTLGMMFFVEPRVAVAGCAWLPICAVVLRRDARRLWRASRTKRTREGEVCGLTQEVVRGMAVIQASGSESWARRALDDVNGRRVRAGREETSVAVDLERKLQILQGIAVALVTASGAWLVIHGRMSLGDLTLMTAYMGQVLKPIEKLNDLAETTGRGLAGGARLLRMLEQKPLVMDRTGASVIARARGTIEFDNVWYTYPERVRPVLRGASLRIAPGELTVLTGESGAGKSTLLSLIVRIADPDRGEIRLDGRSIDSIQLRSLREQFAVLSQDTYLFAGTLRTTLQPDGTPRDDESLWHALATVSLDAFARQLPQLLDTPLGEDGVNLSGGQRRRLALARALLLRRPILLLDEPLANIDAESAAVILDALERVKATCACFAITHDSSLVTKADRLYRLEHGRIADRTRPVEALLEVG